MTINEDISNITKINWNEKDYGISKNKADYKKQLHSVYQLDSLNKIYHNNQEIFISDSEVMYLSECQGKIYKFVSGVIKTKKNKKGVETVTITFSRSFPPFAKLVVDYLIGRFTFLNDKLYDVNDIQAKLMDEISINSLYGFKHDNRYVLDILKGIDKKIRIDPVRKFEPYKISGRDFIVDLEKHSLVRTPFNNKNSYFKFYDVDYDTARQSQDITDEFLQNVIADKDSLHNAMLQPYYMFQVASGLKSKSNFFISKSGVRTGKGLRHIALAGLFKKIDVELDSLTSRGFDSLNAWALFSGGEMALATEQGDIQGEKIERVLKIIATEKSHVARSIGGNQGLVFLTGVLCIDTNRTVALSDEMNGRKVLIQYQDRPSNETDIERENFFRKYWESFTELDKEPKITGSIGFLLSSLSYFKKNQNIFDWKDVEVINNIDLDEFQIALLNALQEVDFVQKSQNKNVLELYNQVYGKNDKKAKDSVEVIGAKLTKRRVNGKPVSGYIIGNKQRFDSFIFEDDETSDIVNLFL